MDKIYHKTNMIKAEQFDGSQKMIKKYGIEDSADSGYNDSDWEDEGLCIPTYEGYLRINNGDWIVTDANGEYSTIADDVFKKDYAELPTIPKGVAEYIESAKHGGTDMNNPDVILAAMGAIEFDQANINVSEWIQDNGDDFARAWLDGYRVE